MNDGIQPSEYRKPPKAPANDGGIGSRSNAQAALLAAATVYTGGRGNTPPASVKIMAESFLSWLNWHDKIDAEAEE